MISTLRTLVPYMIRYRWRYAAGLAALGLKVALTVMIPLGVRMAVDRLVGGGGWRDLALIGGGLLLLSLTKGFFQFWMRWILIGISRDIEYDLRNDLTAHLLGLSSRFFRSYRTGDLMSRAINDLAAVRLVLGPGIMYTVEVSLTLLLALGVMSATDWRLTFFLFLPAPLMSWTVSHFGKLTHDCFEQVQKRLSELTAIAQENFAAARIVRAYAAADAEIERFRTPNSRLFDENIKLIGVWRRFNPLMEFLVGLTYVTTLWFGGRQVMNGSITLGDFVMFLTYLTLLVWPMTGVGWIVNIMQRGTASLDRINELLRRRPRIADGPETDFSIRGVRGDLELRNVTVIYPGAEKPALADVSLYVAAGETLAIVGPVGCGKSTLLNLVPRLIEPTRGTVLVDGTQARKIPLGVLRGAIGLAPQEAFLFSGTIRENLLFGAPEAEMWRLEEAAETAHLADDVAQFPDGYDTIVGERGIQLSGGQRQRVSLARALLRDPRVLILDDTFSAVDTITEAGILDKLRSAMRNRTTLIVSHRVSVARFADRIIVLQNGRIVEQGTHDELVVREGCYADLCRKQSLEEELAVNE